MRLKISTIALWAVVFFTVFTPADMYNLKKASVIIFILLNLDVLIRSLFNKRLRFFWGIVPISILILFLGSFGMSGKLYSSLAGIFPLMYLMIVPVVFELGIPIKRIMVVTLRIMAGAIVLSAFLDLVRIMPVSDNPFLSLISSLRDGQISVSKNAIFYYVLFFNASPLLTFSLADDLMARKYKYAAMTFVALLLTGTRANIYIAGAIAIAYALFILRNKVLSSVIVVSGIVVSPYFFAKIKTINSAKGVGDVVRHEKAVYLLDSIGTTIPDKLFGSGYGVPYYMPIGIQNNKMIYAMEDMSEWSYLEVLRQNGAVGVLVYLALILMPMVLAYRSKYIAGLVGLGAYLLIAVHDPFLTTTTGFILYAVVMSQSLRILERAN